MIEQAITELSFEMNNKGIHKKIRQIGIDFFGKDFDEDSPFWNDLEETIIETLRKW